MGVYGFLFIRRNKSTELVLEFLHMIEDLSWDSSNCFRSSKELPDHETVKRINEIQNYRFVDKFLILFNSSAYLDEIIKSVHKVEPQQNAPDCYWTASEDEECYIRWMRNLYQDDNDGFLFMFALIAFVLGCDINIRIHDETELVGNYYSIIPPEHSLNLHTFENIRSYLNLDLDPDYYYENLFAELLFALDNMNH